MNSVVSLAKGYWACQGRRRRQRVRDAARRLVPGQAWSGTTATEADLARLALLHLLWLQGQTRRAVRARNAEGAALLARSAVDTTIAGLYCLSVPGAAKRYDAGAGKDLKKLLGQFAAATDAGKEALDEMLSFLGSGNLPLTARMVAEIVANEGPPGAEEFYRRYYVPLSVMYAHAGPLALLRHVHPRTNKTTNKPFKMWSRRSALRTTDAMVGSLAAAIAGPDHPDYPLFREYHMAHALLAWPPLLFLVRHLVLRRMHFRHLPGLVAQTRALRAERSRGEDASEAEVDELLSGLASFAGLGPDDAGVPAMASFLRLRLFTASQVTDGDDGPA